MHNKDWPTVAVLAMVDEQLEEGRPEAAQGLVRFWRVYLAMDRDQQRWLLAALEQDADGEGGEA